MAHNTLHVIGARSVARDFHTIVPWPLQHTCWRQFAAQQGDCKKSQSAPFNAMMMIIIIVFQCLSVIVTVLKLFLRMVVASLSDVDMAVQTRENLVAEEFSCTVRLNYAVHDAHIAWMPSDLACWR